MPVEMPKGLPFAVDTWSAESDRKRHRFLTHAHRDHLSCIVSHAAYPIYATRVTISLVLGYYPQIDEFKFVEISVGETIIINDPDGDFSVSAYDANHCPGAVMFLFEGFFGNILHTGDCRLSPDCIQNFPLKYLQKKGKETICKFDFIFLDCTFSRCFLPLPSKQSAIQQVISCIWKHPNAPFIYLACDLLGHEEILIKVSKTFGSKIFVDRSKYPNCFRQLSLTAPQIISNDPLSRFQIVGFPGLHSKAKSTIQNAQNTLQPSPLFIRTSTQWYAMKSKDPVHRGPSLTEALEDEIGVHHVCFSIHSSKEELEFAMELLRPKWVVSTTPPNFAMDLNFVRRNCCLKRVDLSDPLWRVLRLEGRGREERESEERESEERESDERESEGFEPIEIELEIKSPVTLFGRARFGLLDDEFCEVLDEEQSEYVDCEGVERESDEERESERRENNEERKNREKVVVEDRKYDDVRGNDDDDDDDDDDERESEVEKKDEERETNVVGFEKERGFCIGSSSKKFESLRSFYINNDEKESEIGKKEEERETNVVFFEKEREFCIGSSRKLNESLRSFYRSRNVPVPRPLPSLMELMEASKRVKMASKRVNYGGLDSSYSIP